MSLLISASTTRAQDMTNGASSGWRSLFNGEDLTGWKQLNGAHIFEAKDGAIVGTTVPGEPNGFLVTEEEFGDFILEFEVRSDLLMNNSGVQFRSLSHDGYQEGRVHGYQAEIDTKPQKWSGSIYDEARRGWLVTTDIHPESKRAFVNNQWNSYRIEAIGTTNRVWVNGIPTANLEDNLTTRGFIGLQLHANQPNIDPEGARQIRWRNFRIKTTDLQPSPFDDLFVTNLIPNNLSPQEKENGYRLLWDGKSLDGWTGDTNAGFEIVDGAISVGASGTPDAPSDQQLVTNAPSVPFELKFEFMSATDDAVCGLGYAEAGSNVPGSGEGGDALTFCHLASKKAIPDRWNRAVIRMMSNGRTEYWLNGAHILEYQRNSDEGVRWNILIRPVADDMSYRSIKIKEVD
ncbi:MAG: family 16 glycoside hydrolase [Rhodothermales bacterium]|nr:family 16 glycoside hydrolase [Rhodothermales bacterium]